MQRGNETRRARAATAIFTATLAATAAMSSAQTINLQFNGSGNTLAATEFEAVYGLDTGNFNVGTGKLSINTQQGDTFGDYENDPDSAKNMFYNNVAAVPTRTVLESKITVSNLNANFHGGGIWMGTDQDHYVRFGVINNSFQTPPGATVEGLRENEDLWPGVPLPTPPGPGNDIQGAQSPLSISTPQAAPFDIILRLIRDGNGATMFFSMDNGVTFSRNPVPSTGFTFDNVVTGAGQGFNNGASIEGGFKVGVYAFGGPEGQIPATFAFDYFTSAGGTDEWNLTGGGVWDNDSSWTLLTPSSVGATARLGTRITSASTVTVNGDHNVGTLIFDSPNSYTVGGAGTVTFNSFDTYSGTLTVNGQAAINVLQGNHTISANTVISKALTVNVAGAGNTLTVTNGLLSTGTTLLVTKSGPGTLSVKNLNVESGVAVNGGTISIIANGTNAGTSRVGTLSFAGGATPTATLDLKDNDLIVTSGTYAAITNAISKARNGGAWNQPGLTSSSAAAATPKNTTLGTLTGAEYLSLGNTTFDGFTVAAPDVLVKYTYYGDVDFNGLVDFDDYSRIDAGFNNNRTGWFNGDVDYNGIVDFDDYSLIDQAFNTQSGTLRRAMSYLDGSDRSEK
ncbi:MAG: hypothetical protein H7Z14_12950, partial [Anaerolineae bacterium]|nr:hypothetical protein [Phycisphaerae bacterium]